MKNGDAAQVDQDWRKGCRLWSPLMVKVISFRSPNLITNAGKSWSPCVLIITLIARCRCCRIKDVKPFVSPMNPLFNDRYYEMHQ